MPNSAIKLRRNITYPLLTLYGLGTILGAGIYVLIGKIVANAGIYAPVAFLLAAIIAGFNSYSYAALSSRYPQSGGEVNYVNAAFDIRWLSTIVGILLILTGIVSAATLANGFVGYLNVFILLPEILVISLLVIIMTLIAVWGVKQSLIIAGLITLVEIGGLLWVVINNIGALSNLGEYLPKLNYLLVDMTPWFGIFAGSFLAFYAFIGFEDMVNMSEETIQVKKTMPKAVISALIISSIIYIIIAIIAILAVPISQLANSLAPIAQIMKSHSQQAYFIISLVSLIAIINGILVQIIMGSRVLYGMSSSQLISPHLRRLHPNFQTPIIATLFVALMVWISAISLPLVTLAQLTSFIVIIIFLLVNIALVAILKKEASLPTDAMFIRPWIVWLTILLNISFLLTKLFIF